MATPSCYLKERSCCAIMQITASSADVDEVEKLRLPFFVTPMSGMCYTALVVPLRGCTNPSMKTWREKLKSAIRSERQGDVAQERGSEPSYADRDSHQIVGVAPLNHDGAKKGQLTGCANATCKLRGNPYHTWLCTSKRSLK